MQAITTEWLLVLTLVINLALGSRVVTWKTRALEREAQLIHTRLGRFRVRRKFRPTKTFHLEGGSHGSCR